MSLAIFDLDNTLLGDDSDYLWGRFLVRQQLVDGEHYERENQRFYDEYRAGTLDIMEFLSRLDRDTLGQLQDRFMAEQIQPVILPAARQLLARHREQGDTLLIITATNRFITEPIARELEVDDLLATDAEIIGDRYTGKVFGTPCFREGKVTRLEEWLKTNQQNLADSWFYSDSHNDLPLLELVTHPVAVDPDDTLASHAEAKGWPIMSLRGESIEMIASGD